MSVFKNFLGFSTVVAMFATTFMACGDQSSQGHAHMTAADDSKQEEEDKNNALEPCKAINDGDIKYVAAKKQYYQCEDGEWQEVDVDVEKKESSSSAKAASSSSRKNLFEYDKDEADSYDTAVSFRSSSSQRRSSSSRSSTNTANAEIAVVEPVIDDNQAIHDTIGIAPVIDDPLPNVIDPAINEPAIAEPDIIDPVSGEPVTVVPATEESSSSEAEGNETSGFDPTAECDDQDKYHHLSTDQYYICNAGSWIEIDEEVWEIISQPKSSETEAPESSSETKPASSAEQDPVLEAPKGIFLSENGDEDSDQGDVEYIESTGPDGGAILSYRKDISNDKKYGIVVWGPGGGTEPGAYPGMIKRLASHGFVVIAVSSSPGDGSKAIAALDWLQQKNSTDTSVFYQKLDMNTVGCSGHSMGGLEAEQALIKDNRVITAILNNSGDFAGDGACNVPTGKGKTIALVYGEVGSEAPNAEKDYNNASVKVPACLIKMQGNNYGHGSGPWDGLAATVSWMRWHLGGEDFRQADFVGTSGKYIDGPIHTGLGDKGNWNGQCKNF